MSVCVCVQDLALNNLQGFIYLKTQPIICVKSQYLEPFDFGLTNEL